jgi:hypothetical protein
MPDLQTPTLTPRAGARPRCLKCSVQWHRISRGKAACAARPQNLSTTLQEMRRQGTDIEDRQLRGKKAAAGVEKSATASSNGHDMQPTINVTAGREERLRKTAFCARGN